MVCWIPVLLALPPPVMFCLQCPDVPALHPLAQLQRGPSLLTFQEVGAEEEPQVHAGWR